MPWRRILRAKAQFDSLSSDVEQADKELAVRETRSGRGATVRRRTKEARTDAFRACFDVVASTLAEAYKDVTKSARGHLWPVAVHRYMR